jgi:16S rRNA (cytosine1402-N4)-methyltransferase
MAFKHVPVMMDEVIEYLNCRPGQIYMDCTLGGAGHGHAILKKILPGGKLIGIDLDRDAIENAKGILKSNMDNVHLICGNFKDFPSFLQKLAIPSLNGILLDLGISLHQIYSSGRGFSFKQDEPLDMRMSTESEIRAEDLVNNMGEDELSRIFKVYGEERWAWRIAKRIVIERQHQRIESAIHLADIVSRAIPKRALRTQRIHPATRVFMALRIFVNQELESLESFLKIAADYLKPFGRLCVISFHSLEDRIVKNQMREMGSGCVCPSDFPICVCNHKKVGRVLTKKVIRPSDEEIKRNPMARSSRLRVMEKLPESMS